MRPTGAFTGAVLSCLLLTALPASAASVKPGATCTPKGKTVVQNNRKYTCIKSGTKLVWNKGLRLATNQVGTPTVPSPGPTSQAPSERPFVEPPRPATFADLVAQPEAIPYWAWRTSRDVIGGQPSAASSSVRFLIGPNTVKETANAERALANTMRLYGDFAIPEVVTVIFYGFEDRGWAQVHLSSLMLSSDGTETAQHCRTVDVCEGGRGGVNRKGEAYVLVAVPSTGRQTILHSSGSVEAHEFVHSIQSQQFVGTEDIGYAWCCTKRYMPWYLVEGQAEFAQAAAVYNLSYEEYLAERRRDTGALTSKTLTKQWLLDFLNPSIDPAVGRQIWPEDFRLYDIGFLVTECLTAVKGPAATMGLFRDVALGQSFPQAFESRFGLAWSAAVPLLAQAIQGLIPGIRVGA